MKDNLLEVGDELYCYDRFNNDNQIYYSGKIDRVTKTLAFIGNKKVRREYRSWTTVPGDNGYSLTLYYLCDEDIKIKIREQQIRRKLLKPLTDLINNGRKSIDYLTNNQLERINSILEEEENAIFIGSNIKYE